MDGSGVAGVGFVVASGDGPELLQLGEGVLDQVAPAVHVAVEADGGLAVRLGRDHRGGTTGVKLRPEPVGVEGFVAEQGAEGDALDQRLHADAVVALAGQQKEAHQVAESVDEGDDLGCQAAARAADGLIAGPPLAPLAFWWAVTMVPSIRAYSKSGSSDRHAQTRRTTPPRAAGGLVAGPPLAPLAFWWAVTMVPSIRAYSTSGSSDRHAKTRSNTPPFTQRRNRWKTLFQWPNPLGRSRHGAPVRTRHRTPPRNSRLALAGAPRAH